MNCIFKKKLTNKFWLDILHENLEILVSQELRYPRAHDPGSDDADRSDAGNGPEAAELPLDFLGLVCHEEDRDEVLALGGDEQLPKGVGLELERLPVVCADGVHHGSQSLVGSRVLAPRGLVEVIDGHSGNKLLPDPTLVEDLVLRRFRWLEGPPGRFLDQRFGIAPGVHKEAVLAGKPVVAIDEHVHEPDLLGLLRGHRSSRENDPERLLQPDHFWEPNCSSGSRNHAELDLGQAELRRARFRGQAVGASQSKLETSPQSGSLLAFYLFLIFNLKHNFVCVCVFFFSFQTLIIATVGTLS